MSSPAQLQTATCDGLVQGPCLAPVWLYRPSALAGRKERGGRREEGGAAFLVPNVASSSPEKESSWIPAGSEPVLSTAESCSAERDRPDDALRGNV